MKDFNCLECGNPMMFIDSIDISDWSDQVRCTDIYWCEQCNQDYIVERIFKLVSAEVTGKC